MLAFHSIPAAVPIKSPATHLKLIRSIDAGETLFRETDPAPYLFEVVSGTLRMTRLLETGRRQVVAFAHPGDVVGFPANGLHHADCEALTSATVLVYRRSLLDDPYADPDIHRRLQTAALTEISALQDHLLLMARKGACGKLASFLGLLADRRGVTSDGYTALDLKMPRADIADYLCVTVETVSRILTRMRAQAVIRLDTPYRIVVLDRDRLNDMAATE